MVGGVSAFWRCRLPRIRVGTKEAAAMMSLDVIAALNREIARKAARAGRVPYVIGSQSEIDGYESLPFPNLGGYVPPGWREVRRYFLDKSGRGDGFAMGLADLKKCL